MKTLVLGIGNPILGDDGIGCYVARELARKVISEDVAVEVVSLDGLALLEHILGYRRLIVIDAIITDTGVGQVYQLKPEDLKESTNLPALLHQVNLATTIQLGRRLFPDEMPEEIILFAVGIQGIANVTEEITAEVKKAGMRAIELVLSELEKRAK